MIEYLIKRPIAVFMTFLAFVLLGAISLGIIPVTLMPEIDIPHLKIQINEPNYSSYELENIIVKPLRRQLLQVSHLDNIKSKTSNENAYLDLSFEYGTDIDYAIIEVSDNLDKILGSLPKDIRRPVIIKSNSSDIPLLYVNIPYPNGESKINFSKYVDNIIRKRIEQNQSVSHVDITGIVLPEIVISPNRGALERLNISVRDIEKIINDNNSELGSFKIKDGHYISDILFEPTLKDLQNIENLYINTKEGAYKIKDLAKVVLQHKDRKGFFYKDNEESVSLAIFNKKNTKIHQTKNEVINYLDNLQQINKDLTYSISENQTQLLKLSINNLSYSIITGTILAIFIVFLFIRKLKIAFIIGIVIPISLIITFLFLNLIGISINIISLSGLIVGIGMMIDNSLIVIDNITQYRIKGYSMVDSCSKGVYEIIKPLLSSLLTTCAVFIPLLYLSGIPGLLFYDEALSIIISLIVSYITSIILLPTLYAFLNIKVERLGYKILEKKYIRAFNLIFTKKKLTILLSLILIALGTYSISKMDKQKFPFVRYNDFDLVVNWNERISVDENLNRSLKVAEILEKPNNKYIGEQSFLLPLKGQLTSKETSFYIKSDSYKENQKTKEKITTYFNKNYKNSIFTINNSKNLFEQIFPENDLNLIAKIPINYQNEISNISKIVKEKFPNTRLKVEKEIEVIKLEIDINKLSVYKIDVESVLSKLKSNLHNSEISVLKTTNEYLPITIENNKDDLSSLLKDSYIRNNESFKIPLSNFLRIKKEKDIENIYADAGANYIPVIIETDFEEEIISLINDYLKSNIEFEGNYFENKGFIKELFIVILIVILLLYFILAAQFESLLQPLIILSEIPLTICVSMLIVNFFGVSLNIMSMIGLIIMLGIVINDSILKIDAINKSISLDGMTIINAIHNAGKKRLNAILMTSLTTAFAMIPILFTSGIGYDLQKPLALVVIVSMIVGTIVSLFYVPIVYWILSKNNKK